MHENIKSLDPDAIMDPLGVRLSTLVRIRWLAVTGQSMCLVFVWLGLGFDVLPAITLPLVLVSVLLNIWLQIRYDPNIRLSEAKAAWQLAFDLAHLTLLLFFTGGIANPFAVLLLAPTSVSVSILSRRMTRYLMGLSFLAMIALAFSPYPLPWVGPAPADEFLYRIGLWVGLIVALIFVTLYVAQVASESRRRARALAATHMALEREQKLAALGSLSAAIAHELGTPIGTILLASSDLVDEKKGETDDQSQLKLIANEALRCREILAELSTARGLEEPDHFTVQPLEAIVREAASYHEHRGIRIHYRTESNTPLHVFRSPEAIHSIRNIVENAVDYAQTEVLVHIIKTSDGATIKIEDDGPGFDPVVAKNIGEPYVTSKTVRTGGRKTGLGLGIFIAQSLLARLDVNISFGQSSLGGASVRIHWPKQQMADNLENSTGEDDEPAGTRSI